MPFTVQIAPFTSDGLAVNKFSQPSPWVQLIRWSSSQSSENMYLLGYQTIIKGHNWEQPGGRDAQGKAQRGGQELPCPLRACWAPHALQPPSLQTGSKSHLINRTKDTLALLSLRKFHVRNSSPKMGMKTKYSMFQDPQRMPETMNRLSPTRVSARVPTVKFNL